MKRLLLGVGFVALLLGHAQAEVAVAAAIATNGSGLIAAGNTYQTLLVVAAPYPAAIRHSITIENNNASDSCWIDPTGLVASGNTKTTSVTPVGGSAMTSAQASIVLLPGGSYTRYYPYIPSGAIVGTCTTTGDSLYVDTQ